MRVTQFVNFPKVVASARVDACCDYSTRVLQESVRGTSTRLEHAKACAAVARAGHEVREAYGEKVGWGPGIRTPTY